MLIVTRSIFGFMSLVIKREVLDRPDGVTGLAGDEESHRAPPGYRSVSRARDPFRKFAFAVHDEDKLFLLDQVVDQFLVARNVVRSAIPTSPLQDAFFHGRRSLLMEFQPTWGIVS